MSNKTFKHINGTITHVACVFGTHGFEPRGIFIVPRRCGIRARLTKRTVLFYVSGLVWNALGTDDLS